MRTFPTMALLLAATALPVTLPATAAAQGVSAAPATAAPQGRSVVPLADGWAFRFGEAGEEVTRDGFDDSGWERVSVPHTWNRLGEYALTRSAATDNRQGVGYYRLKLDAPAARKGDRQYLDFAAVGKIADVWVNGVHVGQHRGAFSRFRLDVTSAWKPGAANLVVVKADNSAVTDTSLTAQVIPLAGDFFVSGGIYRPVELITRNEAGIDLLDHGGPGVYVRTDKVVPGADGTGASEAQVSVTVRLRNAGKKSRRVEARFAIEGVDGTVSEKVRLRPGEAVERTRSFTIANPRLWNGTADPAMYKAKVEVLDERRQPIDAVTQGFGVRTFRFDADKGFFLNGKHVPLHGVSRHQDRQGVGWALTREDHARDMALIAELGANTVRQAHYQHADEWSDEADKAGMVVWAELPYVGAPSLSGGEGSADLRANAEEQLRELIRQNMNHPSIMMWSIGNEVDSAKAFGAMKEDPSPISLLRRLQVVAKEEDPTRATALADFSEDLGMFAKTRQPLTEVTDVVGYNRYPGWYYIQGAGAGKALGGMMDKLHAKRAKPISISEYGAGGAPSQHSDDPAAGYIAFAGRPQPEEYQSWTMEMLWPEIASRDYIFASWVWNMFDFPSDLRNEGDSVDLNTKGLVTFDRQVRKDAFYYLKAAWTKTPTIQLAGKRYAARSYVTNDIKAYSNAPTARLTLNGRDIGEVPCSNFTCTWRAVPLKPGANEARVEARKDGAVVTDTAAWDGVDPKVNGIRINAGDIAASVLDGKRYGSDTFVTGGKPVPRDSGSIGGRREAEAMKIATSQPSLFDYWREGEAFSYAIPVPDGRWTVTIHTFEPRSSAAPDRRMQVSANGKVVVAPFNISEAAGGPLRGIERSFPVTVRGGVLKLDFAGTKGKAVVAAIEIKP